MLRKKRTSSLLVWVGLVFIIPLALADTESVPVVLSSGWQLQDSAKVAESGEQLSQPDFNTTNWLPATVPGTVLTSLVNDGVYPEPLYGENNRSDKIPDSLCRTDWWYRTTFTIPNEYKGKTVWLNFDGINYAAEVWINGHEAGKIKGAFIRGIFDVSAFVEPGKKVALAVRISPEPTPGEALEHTIRLGTGNKVCVTPADGATFLCTIGWDWIPAIRDRDAGIWQKVFLSATGPAVIKDPYITTDLPLPNTDSADVSIQATLQNVSDQPVKGELKGSFDDVSVQQSVELKPHSSQMVTFNPKTYSQLHVLHPKLWWPNGLGAPNLHTLHLSLECEGKESDSRNITFGIRKITYAAPGSDNLALSVNGVPVFAKGGNWGMDEALKRVPHDRLEAQIKMHQLANYNMIRNWVGQSTSADLYDLCDRYGILVWDEFFEPSSGAPPPADVVSYLANVRDKIVRFRDHPCITVWCARNEGYPPKEIDDAIKAMMTELDPSRLYQSNSKDGRGVHSGGPYAWRTPQSFYEFPDAEAFKTEVGSVSIPTIESIQGMMPEKDWETINDDWAEHDLTRGAQERRPYLTALNNRYGKAVNLADFVRKGQLMNYEAFRAMYEGRLTKLFKPTTGVLTWMSNPAQPSFVWQIYHYDLEPNSALFAVRKACEPVHLQLNEKEGTLQMINHLPSPLTEAKAHLAIYNLDGSLVFQKEFAVTAAPTSVTDLGPVPWPQKLSPVFFVQLQLDDVAGKRLSDNFYWRADPAKPDDLTALDQLTPVTLEAKATRHEEGDKLYLDVTLRNPGPGVAVMTHLQLRRAEAKTRVLPVYYSDNYISLAPKEEKTVRIEADKKLLAGETPLVLIDGWNIGGLKAAPSAGITLALNQNAQVDHWPKNGISIFYGTPQAEYHINCGGGDVGAFKNDDTYASGPKIEVKDHIDASVPQAAPEAIYQSCRFRKASYIFAMKPLAPGRHYTVRLHFAELVLKQSGQRKFDIKINGKVVLKDFDIVQAAGAMDKAVVKEFPGVIPDDEGTIEVDPNNPDRTMKELPAINGIEIIPD